jgi:hypothetical protein
LSVKNEVLRRKKNASASALKIQPGNYIPGCRFVERRRGLSSGYKLFPAERGKQSEIKRNNTAENSLSEITVRSPVKERTVFRRRDSTSSPLPLSPERDERRGSMAEPGQIKRTEIPPDRTERRIIMPDLAREERPKIVWGIAAPRESRRSRSGHSARSAEAGEQNALEIGTRESRVCSTMIPSLVPSQGSE